MKKEPPIDTRVVPTVSCLDLKIVTKPNVKNNIPTDVMRTDACCTTI